MVEFKAETHGGPMSPKTISGKPFRRFCSAFGIVTPQRAACR